MKTYSITASQKDTGKIYHLEVLAMDVFDAIKFFAKELEDKHSFTIDRIDCISLDLMDAENGI